MSRKVCTLNCVKLTICYSLEISIEENVATSLRTFCLLTWKVAESFLKEVTLLMSRIEKVKMLGVVCLERTEDVQECNAMEN